MLQDKLFVFFFNKETAGGKKKGERQRENLQVKKDLRNLTTNHNSISYLNIDSNQGKMTFTSNLVI